MARKALIISLISAVFMLFISPSMTDKPSQTNEQAWVDEVSRHNTRRLDEMQGNQEERLRAMQRRREELFRDHEARRRTMEERGQAIERDFEARRKTMARAREKFKRSHNKKLQDTKSFFFSQEGYIPFALKNSHFQRASFREGRRCRSLKEMTLPALLRLDLHENLPTQNGHS